MSPGLQTSAYLAKANQALDKARRVLAIDIAGEAGRHAYYAQFHAAQALIFERMERTSRGICRRSINSKKLTRPTRLR
jgi:uncharacterized protein (UPF0332 family)